MAARHIAYYQPCVYCNEEYPVSETYVVLKVRPYHVNLQLTRYLTTDIFPGFLLSVMFICMQLAVQCLFRDCLYLNHILQN